jgi:hypothetical protein
MVLLAGVVSGCATAPGSPPVDVASSYVLLLCFFNCPLSINVADEGQVTDTIPLEYPHLVPEVVTAINEGR